MLLGGIALLSAVISVLIGVSAGAFAGFGWLWILPLSFAGVYLGLFLLAFLFLLVMCAIVDTSKPQEKDSKFYRAMTALYIDAIVPILMARCHVEGLEKTPKDGRFLLVCNHTSLLDVVILLKYFKKSQLAFISKRENNTMFLIGKIMHKLSCPLINRENDREALKTILKSIQLIKDDEVSIAVFPEGYISKDYLLHPFRNGVFKIAQKSKVPVVVCTLKNTSKIKENLPKLHKTDVYLHLVKVVQPEEYEGMNTVQLGDQIHQLMEDDLGPDLVWKAPESDAENT